MHRTIGDSYGTSGTKKIFRAEVPSVSDATQVTYDTMNALQEEIANVIEGLGGALNTSAESVGDMKQMYTLLAAEFSSEANTRNANDRVLNGDLVRDQVNTLNTNAGKSTLDATAQAIVRGKPHGFALFRSSGTSILIGPGNTADAAATAFIVLGSSIAKSIDANWAAGTGNGGFPSALTLTSGTWYHLFVIKSSGGTVDAGYDSDTNASNLLTDSGYSYYRRVGSVYYVNGTTGIRDFIHEPQSDMFLWKSVPIDASLSAVSVSPAVSTFTLTLGVPEGLTVEALLSLAPTNAADFTVLLWGDSIGSALPAVPPVQISGKGGDGPIQTVQMHPGAARQIHATENVAASGTTISIGTAGYRDNRYLV